jgi:hypothetical protein
MTTEQIQIGEPFFSLDFVESETAVLVGDSTIVVNLSESPIRIENQTIGELQSNYLVNTTLRDVRRAILIRKLRVDLEDRELCRLVEDFWPSAYEVRKEARLKNVGHFMSEKCWVRGIGFTFYHSATVPLRVGLHKDHDFCPVPGYREVHTQIVGIGKMQQCRAQDLSSLYFEELMAPGNTHRPMYDQDGNYPWHQYETITPSIFLAIEMLPEGVPPPS